MGLSPFYRGSSCNFWAIKDKKPEFVGSTIHYLSKDWTVEKLFLIVYLITNKKIVSIIQ